MLPSAQAHKGSYMCGSNKESKACFACEEASRIALLTLSEALGTGALQRRVYVSSQVWAEQQRKATSAPPLLDH